MPPVEEPARPPLITDPVALMRLVEIDDIGEALDHLGRLGLGPADLLAETKFNGWLVQSAGGRLWSRRGNIDLTGKFPEIARAVARYDREHLAGELVYWTPEGVMSEPTVTTVAGTKDDREAVAKLRALPGRFEYVIFDALALRGYEVAKMPLQERKRALIEVVKAAPPLRISMEHPFEAWEEVYDQGVAAGGDGVVIKNRHAPYVWRPLDHSEPRPLGNQYKLKPVVTDDFVVYDTAKGPKGRLLMVFGQFHKGRLVPVGAVNNLARELEREVLHRIVEGPFVVELEFQGRFPDPPGALQHARFLRFRPDKKPEDVVLPERFAPRPGTKMGSAQAFLGAFIDWKTVVPPREWAPIEALIRRYDVLAAEIDRSYETGAIEGIEDLEAETEGIHEKLIGLFHVYAEETESPAGEGIGLEEYLAVTYAQRDRFRSDEDWIDNMRDAIRTDLLWLDRDVQPTDEQVLTVAKDAYERRRALFERYKKAAKTQRSPTMGAVAKHWPYPNPENLPIYWIPTAPDGLPKLWEVRYWPIEDNLFEIVAMRYEASPKELAPVVRTVWDAGEPITMPWPRLVSIEAASLRPWEFRLSRWPASPWYVELLARAAAEHYPGGLP